MSILPNFLAGPADQTRNATPPILPDYLEFSDIPRVIPANAGMTVDITRRLPLSPTFQRLA
jgi:hypothetical protein